MYFVILYFLQADLGYITSFLSGLQATRRAESRQELQQRLQEKLEQLKGSKRDGTFWYGNHKADCIYLSFVSVPGGRRGS